MVKLTWRNFLWAVFIIPGIPFVVISLGLCVYIYWPSRYENIALLDTHINARHQVLLFHGLKDTPATWAHPLEQVLQTYYRKDTAVTVAALDWHEYAQSAFRCSVNGQRIGVKLGRTLLAYKRLQSLHLIAHSCGAFVVYGLCKTVKAARPDIKIQTSYLDPVSVYGGFFWDYGLAHFGRCADFSDAYVDHEDGIPGSNQALPFAYTFDVTALKKSAAYQGNPHVWPAFYYLQAASEGRILDLSARPELPQRYPKGDLLRLRAE